MSSGRADQRSADRSAGWLRRLGPYVRPHRATLLGALACSVAAQVLIGVLPLIQKVIVDDSIITDRRRLGPVLVLLVLIGVAGFVTNYGRRYFGAKVSVDLQHDLRRAMHRHLYELDFSRHDELSVGDVMSRATADLTLVQQFFFSIPMLLANVTLLVVAMAVMVVLSPLLSVVVGLFVPVFAVVAMRFRAHVFPASWNDQRLSGLVAGVVDENVAGVRVVKAFAQEDRELARLVDRARDLYRSRMRTARFNARYSSTLQALPMLAQLGVLVVGGVLALHGRITVGVFLAFASYLVQIVTPVRLVSSMLSNTQQARAGAERVFELLDLRPRVAERPGAQPIGAVAGSVELDRVTFAYGGGQPMLRDVSFSIAPGERVGIVGASGSGKSTLAHVLARFYDPGEGAVRIDGVDVRGTTLTSLRRAVSVVFEETFLFSTSIRENIAYARPDATAAEIEAAARVARVHAFVSALPDGYDTLVGERGYTLSGGERQRIALARAVLADPAVLVLDDATSAMDARTEEAIHGALAESLGERTTILIAHRASTLRLADRVLVLDGGRVVAEGTNAELWQTCPLYRELLTGPDVPDEEPAAAAVASVDPAAWPDVDRNDDHAPRVELASLFASMAVGGAGGAGGAVQGVRAGLVAATPALLARVERLPPLRGDPDVDVADVVAPDGRSSFGQLAHRFRWPLAGIAGLVTVDGATTLVGPLVVRHALDAGVTARAGGVLAAMYVAFLAVQLVSWANQALELAHTSRTAERMLFALRARTFAHLQRLSLDYYDRELGGRIMTRMTTDVEALAQLFQQGLLVALTSVVSCIGVVGVLLGLDVRLAMATFVVLPALLAATIWFQQRSRGSYLEARDAISIVNAELQESLSGVRVTQALGRDDNNAARFAARSRRYRDARLRSMRLMATYFAVSQLLSTVAKAIVLWYGGHQVSQGHVSAGLLVAFLLYLDQFFTPLQQLSAVFDQWIQARISLSRLDDLLATPSSTPPPADPVALGAWSGGLELEGVRFAYAPTAPEALRGVDLRVEAGRSLALVGTTGAGKSTFVKLLARFYDPTAGVVRANGVDLRRLDLRSYRRRLGYVPQEPFLYTGTIRSIIAYARPGSTDLDVERAARAVGAHDFVRSLPLGYHTPVTDGGRSLSAGQRQLLCLARALLVDPVLLILDEATSNLDLATEADVQRAMARVAAGRTTVLIAHRLQTARSVSRIVVVDDGRVVEDGSHDELVSAHGRYAQLWEAFDQAATPVMLDRPGDRY